MNIKEFEQIKTAIEMMHKEYRGGPFARSPIKTLVDADDVIKLLSKFVDERPVDWEHA